MLRQAIDDQDSRSKKRPKEKTVLKDERMDSLRCFSSTTGGEQVLPKFVKCRKKSRKRLENDVLLYIWPLKGLRKWKYLFGLLLLMPENEFFHAVTIQEKIDRRDWTQMNYPYSQSSHQCLSCDHVSARLLHHTFTRSLLFLFPNCSESARSMQKLRVGGLPPRTSEWVKQHLFQLTHPFRWMGKDTLEKCCDSLS